MTYDNFTIKAQESILKAQQIAGALEQQSVDTTHLLKGIMETDDSVPKFLFSKMGMNIASLRVKLDKAVKNYPKVAGAQKQYLTSDANRALSRAKKLLKDFGDDFISVEMMILGILNGTDQGGRLLKELGGTDKDLRAAILSLIHISEPTRPY